MTDVVSKVVTFCIKILQCKAELFSVSGIVMLIGRLLDGVYGFSRELTTDYINVHFEMVLTKLSFFLFVY